MCMYPVSCLSFFSRYALIFCASWKHRDLLSSRESLVQKHASMFCTLTLTWGERLKIVSVATTTQDIRPSQVQALGGRVTCCVPGVVVASSKSRAVSEGPGFQPSDEISVALTGAVLAKETIC